MLYFWRPVLLKKCQKAQNLCVTLIHARKWDTILPEVERIHTKLWILFQFSSGPGVT